MVCEMRRSSAGLTVPIIWNWHTLHLAENTIRDIIYRQSTDREAHQMTFF